MKDNIPSTHEELEQLRTKKMNSYYKVNESFETVTKDVDFSKRKVQVIPNTYLFFDSDFDVLMPGAASKTIKERGPDSISSAKIKNVKDHVISDRIGKPTLMDERKIDEKEVMYAESDMLRNTKGNDMLIEYQEGVIDQHSIGFRYIELDMVTADDREWEKMLAMLINPKDAEKVGFMFPVKEVEMFEFSPVSFGSNKLTPYLGVKSGNKEATQLKLYDRLDILYKQLSSGRQSDETMRDYELEVRQIKQIISELFSEQPSPKDTLLKSRQNTIDIVPEFNVMEAIKKTNFF